MNGEPPAPDRRSERFAACGDSFFNNNKTGEYDRLGKGFPK
jgi:hypothetical protein